MTTTDTEHDIERDDAAPWWTSTWPLGLDHWIRLAVSLAVVIAAFVVVGEMLTNLSIFEPLVEYDERLANDLAADRTESLNSLAHWSSLISDTPVKIVASVVIAGLLLWRLRRWREALMVGLPLVFEATAYIVTSFIVQRPRPDVERLLDSPVDTTFPSGHVAAATVYAALLFIVLWHTRSTTLRTLAVLAAVIAPIMVAWARMYQGMHYLTDVVAGVALGLVSVIACRRVIRAPADAEDVIFDDRVRPEGEAV